MDEKKTLINKNDKRKKRQFEDYDDFLEEDEMIRKINSKSDEKNKIKYENIKMLNLKIILKRMK